jgi:hypothetical protein
VANTRTALLMLGGHFSFSGDLLAEEWMLKQAGFVDDSPTTSAVRISKLSSFVFIFLVHAISLEHIHLVVQSTKPATQSHTTLSGTT